MEIAEEVARRFGFAFENGRFVTPKPALEFEQAFQLLYARAFDEHPAKEQVVEEQLRGRGLWSEIVASDPDVRLAAVSSDRRFHTWGFFDAVLEEARNVWRRDPEEAVRMAQLALAVHARLDPKQYTAALLADFEAPAIRWRKPTSSHSRRRCAPTSATSSRRPRCSPAPRSSSWKSRTRRPRHASTCSRASTSATSIRRRGSPSSGRRWY